MIPEDQDKVLHRWQSSARYWDRHRDLIAEMFAPLTSSLVEQARIGIGQKVLDIGGGHYASTAGSAEYSTGFC
jgi:cyclopropane fatty-acyl-phospholipid synthase-like methyltransferase